MDGPDWATGVVAGPAGSGKTMLLVQYLDVLRGCGSPAAWLSVDTHDDEPAAFWSGVLSATSVACAPIDAEVSRRLDGLRPPTGPVDDDFLAAFGATLAPLPAPLHLVLDDAHALRTAGTIDGLARLPDLGPRTLRVVLGCRGEPPLPADRLAAEGRSWRLDAADLAFDAEEARALLRLHRVPLTDDLLAGLMARTEGWAAGLRLAALSLADRPDAPALVTDDRTGEYLESEVLQRLPPDRRVVMAATVVPDEVTVGLAERLTGRVDAGAVLERFVRDDLLVTRVGTDPPRYRYHPLLRSHLLGVSARQNSAALQAVHAEVGEWSRDAGDPDAALAHATAGEDWLAVLDLLDLDGPGLVLRAPFRTVRDAVARLPTEFQDAAPALLVRGLLALLEGDLVAARPYLDLIGPGVPGVADDWHGTLRAALRLHAALLRGARADELTGLMNLLGGAPPGPGEVGALAAAVRGRARSMLGDHDGAAADLAYAAEQARRRHADYLVLYCLTQLAVTSSMAGRLPESADRAESAIGFAADRGWLAAGMMAPTYGVAACTAWIRADPDVVERHLGLARAVGSGVEPTVALTVQLLSAYTRFERTVDAADMRQDTSAIWRQADERVIPAPALGIFCLTEVTVALDFRDEAWARHILSLARWNLPRSGDLMVIRSLAHLRTGRRTAARTALEPVLAGDVACPLYLRVHAWLLALEIAVAEARPAVARAALRTALELAAPSHIVRPFLDRPVRTAGIRTEQNAADVDRGFLDRLLVAAGRRVPPSAGRPQLTQRETDLLHDLPSLLSMEEIARVHVLSGNTVKTHLRALYRKLDVHSRREAVDRAREIGLL
jgi:LuxR family transcriptional regulator, maltose regulon positive regulatory protein